MIDRPTPALAPTPPATVAPRDLHCRLLYSGLTTITPEWNHSLCNPFWRLYHNDEDGASILHPGGEHQLPAGRLSLIPAWGKFQSRCIKPVRHFYVHFDPLGLNGDWEREHFTHPITLAADPTREDLARSLRDRQENSPIWRLRMQSLILGCLAQAIAQLPAESLARFDRQLAGHDPIGPALRHIEGHLHDKLPIPLLAKFCKLSVDHFSRIFRQRVGQTPTRYLQERRIAVAAERLIATRDDIARVAADTGFANRYHFTRVFTNRMGTPPATYRRTGRV